MCSFFNVVNQVQLLSLPVDHFVRPALNGLHERRRVGETAAATEQRREHSTEPSAHGAVLIEFEFIPETILPVPMR